MHLPEYVQNCIDSLENAGFAAYAVGGCVRDALLGLVPQDYDLCTAALPEETEAVFAGHSLILAGKKHGTVGVVTQGGVVEITTFRIEAEYRDNRHPDAVEFVSDIEKDLARRDFTVNAMAYSPSRGYADPFGGQGDLEKRLLRAVGDPVQRFQEDSLRILRGVRFAARFGMTLDRETADAMVSQARLMENLARERVFDELCKLLPTVSAADLSRFAPVLVAVIPELAPTVGFQQHSRHHSFDLYTHIAHVVESVPPVLPLRWAALLHDLGKITTFTLDEAGEGHFYGHAQESAAQADTILRRLKAPNQLREQVVTLIKMHMTWLEPNKKVLRRQLRRLGWDALRDLLTLQEADTGSKGTGKETHNDHFAAIHALLAEIEAENACLTLKDLAVNGHDLMQLGYRGKDIGQALNRLLEKVVDEELPNEKQLLLASLKLQ